MHPALKNMSLFGSLSWVLGITVLTYLGFLLYTLLTVGSKKAVGVGVFPMIVYNPWFWATVVLLLALVFLWKLR